MSDESCNEIILSVCVCWGAMLSSANQVYASLRRFVPNSVDFPSKTFGNNQKGFKKVSYNFVLSF